MAAFPTPASSDAVIRGRVALTGADGAALEGLGFTFPEATFFGFPGEATAFTLLTSGATVINGTSSNGGVVSVACRLRQHAGEVGAGAAPFDEAYGTYEAWVESTGAIAFGSAGTGAVILSLSRVGTTPVASEPEEVTLYLHEGRTATINKNATPI